MSEKQLPYLLSSELTACGYKLKYHWVFILTSFVAAAVGSFAAISHRTGTNWWTDLNNGDPKAHELGLGHFDIVGYTFPFAYPYRLVKSTIPSQLTPWLCFVVHQVGQWWIISQARTAKLAGKLDWTEFPHWNKYALRMLKLNVLMIVVRYLQTHMFYDGLSATFPSISALFSGVSSLVVVYIFKFRTRGVVFGWTPTWFAGEVDEFCLFLKHYHGYISSFGIILNFWHHPLEVTLAHFTGFFHTFLLLWQSSLLYQRGHSNRYWAFLLESMIWVHGATVAYCQHLFEGLLFKMFLCSFMLVVIMGPVWGLPALQEYVAKSRQRHQLALFAMFVPFSMLTVYLYTHPIQHVTQIWMVIDQPFLYYTLFTYYFMAWRVGKWIDKQLLQRVFKLKQESAVRGGALVALTAMPLLSVMLLAACIFWSLAPKQVIDSQ